MGISIRRLLPAFIFAALSSVVFIAPPAASAEVTKHCVPGTEIHGEGSSLQAEAEEKWDPDFITSKAATACDGEQGEGGKPVVKYTKEASAVGMKKWGFGSDGNERSDATTQFVGTDQPPNATQIAEIETQGGTRLAESKLQTIPVVEESIAVIVHLPKGCTVTSTDKASPGRFVLTQTQLEEAFAGEITKWNEITGVVGAKSKAENKWTGESCGDTIKRTVRGDGSGTTSIFKKYLNLIKEVPAEFGGKKWKTSAEETENTEWPNETADAVTRGKCGTGEACTSSGGKLAEWVQEHEDSLGYAGIADSRNKDDAGELLKRSEHGQEGAQIFWVEVQYGGTETKPKFEEPAVVTESGEGAWDSNAKTTANCADTTLSNGTSSVKFPPKNTEEPWNEATTKKVEKGYGICGLSYILAYAKYSLFEGFNEGDTATVSNFVKFVLGSGAEEGQTIANTKADYIAVPTGKTAKTNVLDIARTGAEKIGY